MFLYFFVLNSALKKINSDHLTLAATMTFLIECWRVVPPDEG